MIDHGVAMTSTLAIYETFVPNRPPLEERVLELMAPEVRAEYLATREEIAATADSSAWPGLFERAKAYEGVRRAGDCSRGRSDSRIGAR
jgi:hypothetical protein